MQSKITNATLFARLIDGDSWNAHFRSDGRVIYWRSSNIIDHATWNVRSDGAICIYFQTGSGCRYLVPNYDGSYDWVDGASGSATSSIIRIEQGDAFELSNRRQEETLIAPLRQNNRSKWVQTHSFRSHEEAQDKAAELRSKNFKHANVIGHRNGWFVVTVGYLAEATCHIPEGSMAVS